MLKKEKLYRVFFLFFVERVYVFLPFRFGPVHLVAERGLFSVFCSTKGKQRSEYDCNRTSVSCSTEFR